MQREEEALGRLARCREEMSRLDLDGLVVPTADPHLSEYVPADWKLREALSAFIELSRREGIIPALESAHALAYALKLARENPEKEQSFIVNLSGRGDKDIFQVSGILEAEGLFTNGRLSPDAAAALLA